MKIKFVFILFFNTIIFSQTPTMYPDFPLLLDSNHQGTLYGGFEVPLAADIDKDGNKEIILASDLFALRVIKTNGQNQPGFPKYYNDPIRFISCGDVDGNGYLDIVLRNDRSIIVLDKNGNTLNGFPIIITLLDGRKFASLYDLDNDGKLEIIADIADIDTGLVVYNYNGQIRNGWPVIFTERCQSSPALGDIDNDGFGEIIIGTGEFNTGMGALRILRHNGANFSGIWPLVADSAYLNYYGPPALYIKQSPSDTTFICLSTNRYVNGQYTSSRITKYNINGDIIKRINPIVSNAISQMIIGKLDDNIYFGTGNVEGQCYLFTSNLTLCDGWPNRGIQYDHFFNIIFGKLSSNNNKDIASFIPGADIFYGYGIAYGYKINGELHNWFPLRTYGLEIGHAFADINNDGNIEYIYHTVQHDIRWLKIITIPEIPFTSENFPWPVYGHDRYRTNQYGYIPPDEPNGIEYISNKIPKAFELYQNYPNPFNASTIIRFELRKASHVKLSVYDILGRNVTELTDLNLEPGSYRISWHTAGLSSGVYFYELITKEENKIIYNEVRKAVIVK